MPDRLPACLPAPHRAAAAAAAAGVAPLLEDPQTAITLFAPEEGAWQAVSPAVHLGDRETLQEVLTFLIVQVQYSAGQYSSGAVHCRGRLAAPGGCPAH